MNSRKTYRYVPRGSHLRFEPHEPHVRPSWQSSSIRRQLVAWYGSMAHGTPWRLQYQNRYGIRPCDMASGLRAAVVIRATPPKQLSPRLSFPSAISDTWFAHRYETSRIPAKPILQLSNVGQYFARPNFAKLFRNVSYKPIRNIPHPNPAITRAPPAHRTTIPGRNRRIGVVRGINPPETGKYSAEISEAFCVGTPEFRY